MYKKTNKFTSTKALNNMTITGNTVEIALTQGKTCFIDEADLEMISQHKWYAAKDRNNFYVQTNIRKEDGSRKTLKMHQLLMNTPEDMVTDHRNHDGLDNRRENLRICTNQQNLMNSRSHKNSTSRYKGVCYHKANGKWMANIQIDGKQKYLGLFISEISAAQAYNRAAKELFGSLSVINTSKTLPMSQERGA